MIEPKITVRQIQRTVAAYYDIPRETMQAKNRKRKFSHPRQVAMFIARKNTKFSLPQLGQRFCRHHTTIIHGIRRTASRMNSVAYDIAQIEGHLRAGTVPLPPEKYVDETRVTVAYTDRLLAALKQGVMACAEAR